MAAAIPKNNPRFVMTDVADPPETVYTGYEIYCQRGGVENRLKELHHKLEMGRHRSRRSGAMVSGVRDALRAPPEPRATGETGCRTLRGGMSAASMAA